MSEMKAAPGYSLVPNSELERAGVAMEHASLIIDTLNGALDELSIMYGRDLVQAIVQRHGKAVAEGRGDHE